MGCDIHSYVEHKHKDSNYWQSFGGRINPGRIYGMFAKLADVRNDYGMTAIAPERGVPNDISHTAFGDYSMYVVNDGEDNNNGEYAERSKAERWVKSGSSAWLRDDEKFISQPDWHSASWCTAAELEQAINEVWSGGKNGCQVEYLVLLSLLKSFEDHGQDARLVFWFDN